MKKSDLELELKQKQMCDELIATGDKRYSLKWVESVFKLIMGCIATGFVAAILRLILK